jgi:hypothetical protein
MQSCSYNKKIDNERTREYVGFIDTIDTSAKEYILSLFNNHDIVIIAERFHTEETQYELINEIISDQYFIANVGNICIEIGSSNLSDTLNSFLKAYHGDMEAAKQRLLELQRNISFYPVWNRESYRSLLFNLLTLNSTLEQSDKINLFICDREFDWTKIHTRNDWRNAVNNNRDSIIAHNISKYYEVIKNTSRNKVLLILNEAHAIPNVAWKDKWQKRAAQYLSEKYGNDNIASVVLNSVRTNRRNKDILIQDGYWDAAFSICNITTLGFDFQNSPFGEDFFDYAEGENNDQFRYKDIFTGFVFYKPLNRHRLSTGVNGIVDNDFRDEFLRRIRIYNGRVSRIILFWDKKLNGFNQIEYHKYDSFSRMQLRLDRIKKGYNKTTK